MSRRRRVPNDRVERRPYGQIAQLIVRYGPGDGPRAFGTGFFIGERCVATAAHVLMPLDGRRAENVTVTPARQGGWAPKGHYVSGSWTVHTRWERRASGLAAHDFGCIFLPRHDPRPDRAPIDELELAVLSDDDLEDKPVMAAGFPKMETADAYMYRNLSEIDRTVSEFWLDYAMTTRDGESGSPLLMRRGNKYVVVGIHTMRLGGGSRMGVRVTKDVEKWFARRLTESNRGS